jgi:hypothetical protein
MEDGSGTLIKANAAAGATLNALHHSAFRQVQVIAASI